MCNVAFYKINDEPNQCSQLTWAGLLVPGRREGYRPLSGVTVPVAF